MIPQKTRILKPHTQKEKNQDQKVTVKQKYIKKKIIQTENPTSLQPGSSLFGALYWFQLTAAEHQLHAPYVAAHMLFLQLSKGPPLVGQPFREILEKEGNVCCLTKRKVKLKIKALMCPKHKLLASSMLREQRGCLQHMFNTPEADELSAAVLVELRKVSVISTALLFLMLKSFLWVSSLEQL